MSDQRQPFIEMLHKFASQDPRIKLIVGDVGFNFMEPYIRKFPSQFLNAGAGEANMMGVANGLARVGWKPYVYSMINFIISRPNEHLRNDICYGNSNVKLFGVKGSAAYKFLGYSHNVADDEEERLLKLPNLNIYFPESPEETIRIMETEYKRIGPAYMRL